MKLFLFGIGGTGPRVLRSLMMLLAAGAKTADNLTIIPILLDMDLNNGDTERALRALDDYRLIRRMAYPDSQTGAFFRTPIQPLSTLQAEGASEKIGDSVMPRLTDHDGTFEEFLQVGDLAEVDRELLKLLYDNSARPQTAELKLDLSVGFKGNPNIGSVVFNALEDSPAYKYFISAFNDRTDRIFVVSSIFGGTGSSGFPQLVKLLQDPGQRQQVRQARKGAVTVMPYFALESNTQSAIDQNRFLSKTKAALTYYQTQIQLDALYYIGDQPGARLYPNVEGGGQQRNNAHVVEMLAAAAVLDFANKPDGDFTPDRRYYEFGIKADAKELDLAHFYDRTYNDLLEPLLRFTYAAKFFSEFVPQNLDQAFAKNLKLTTELATNSYYTALKNFMGVHFTTWLQEMARNDRAFAPFRPEADFNSLVRSKTIETGFFEKGISRQFLRDQAGKLEDQLQKQYPQSEARFMHLLLGVAEACRDKLGPLNRTLTAN
jgi:Tubulin like